MKFSEIVDQASALLQRKQRITYRTLRREFALDDDALEDLKFELIDGQRIAIDEDGKVLVWTGAAPVLSPPQSPTPDAHCPEFGSPKGLTLRICKTPRRSSRN
jgi:hypothetical protein